jgi:hypothetical protein
LAPAVGFEPTTNRLTADRSTTELRWIICLKTGVHIFAHDRLEATANPAIDAADRHVRRLSPDNSSTMKELFSVMLVFAVCAGSVQAGPVRTARNVAKNTVITAKNVAHSVVKGTRRAVHTVVHTLTR